MAKVKVIKKFILETVVCPVCKSDFRVNRYGIHNCPYCGSELQVDPDEEQEQKYKRKK